MGSSGGPKQVESGKKMLWVQAAAGFTGSLSAPFSPKIDACQMEKAKPNEESDLLSRSSWNRIQLSGAQSY